MYLPELGYTYGKNPILILQMFELLIVKRLFERENNLTQPNFKSLGFKFTNINQGNSFVRSKSF